MDTRLLLSNMATRLYFMGNDKQYARHGVQVTQTHSASTQDLPTRMVRRFGRMIF